MVPQSEDLLYLLFMQARALIEGGGCECDGHCRSCYYHVVEKPASKICGRILKIHSVSESEPAETSP